MSCTGLFFSFIKNIYMKVSALSEPFQTEAKVNVWKKKKKRKKIKSLFFFLFSLCCQVSLPAALTTAALKEKFTFN